MSTNDRGETRSAQLTPGPDTVFRRNPTARLPMVLILDKSSSMEGTPIQEVNTGYQNFVTLLKKEDVARNRIDASIIFVGNGMTIHQENVKVDDLDCPTLEADGDTPLGEAIVTTLAITEAQKQYYKSNDISYIQPVVVCLTDGEPTDPEVFEEAINQLLMFEAQNKVSFRVIGCNGAKLEKFNNRGLKYEPKVIDNKDIEKFFETVSVVVSSQVDENGQVRVGDIAE